MELCCSRWFTHLLILEIKKKTWKHERSRYSMDWSHRLYICVRIHLTLRLNQIKIMFMFTLSKHTTFTIYTLQRMREGWEEKWCRETMMLFMSKGTGLWLQKSLNFHSIWYYNKSEHYISFFLYDLDMRNAWIL